MARGAARRGAALAGGGGAACRALRCLGGRVADAARRCRPGGGRAVQSAMRAPAGWSSSTDRSACSKGESEAVVTMVPSPAARSVVVGGNCPCGGRAWNEQNWLRRESEWLTSRFFSSSDDVR